MLSKISNKIIFYYTALILILISLLLLFFVDFIKKTHLDIIKNEMDEKVRFIELVLSEEPNLYPENMTKFSEVMKNISTIINLRLTIVDFSGKLIYDSELLDISKADNHRYRPEIMESLEKGTGNSVRYSNSLKTNMLYYSKKSANFYVRLAKPLYSIENSMSDFRKLILILGGSVILISIGIIIFISRIITKPINETLSFAESFSSGDYTRRILNYHEDEIGNLQRTLNKLADTIVDKINSLMIEQNKLNTTLESISDGIALIDKQNHIIISNKAFNSIFDLEKNPAGKSYYEAIRSRSLNHRIEDSLKNDIQAISEEKISNGHYEINIFPVNGDNFQLGILIVLHNVTEKKKLEKMKTDLIGNMSHELKTPIAIIKGYLETIQENITNKEISSDFIKKAIENADRQNSLINDILKLHMLETTKDFSEETLDTSAIINNCVNVLRPKMVIKNIYLENKIRESKIPAKGNSFLAEEIFFNIIDNAINYNKQSGSIIISGEKKEGIFIISIEDTGIGIPPESIDRVFERFYRVDKSRSRATGGTGLGLSIVKHAAELMGWKLSLNSNEKGTLFIIEVPL